MPDQAKRYALLIGNDRYQDLAELEFPVPDLERLRDVLRDPAVGGFTDVQILSRPDLAAAQAAIGELFSGRNPDDLVVLYFSGCARRDPASDGLYLELADSRPELIRSTAISSGFVTTEMEASGAARQVLILDCRCRGSEDAPVEDISAADFGGAVRPEPADSPGAAANGYGRVTLASSVGPHDHWDGNRVVNGVPRSLFTHLLIQGLATGDAAGENALLSVEQLYRYLHRLLAGAAQAGEDPLIPERFVHRQKGELVIAANPCQSPSTQPEQPLEPKPSSKQRSEAQDETSGMFTRPEDLLPDDLIRDLKSTDPNVRLGGIRELVELMREPSLNLAVRAVLRGHLSAETDDGVRGEIESAFAADARPAPEPPPRDSDHELDPADSEDLHDTDVGDELLLELPEELEVLPNDADAASAPASPADRSAQEPAADSASAPGKGSGSVAPAPAPAAASEMPAGLNLVDVGRSYKRRLPSWLEPKRKKNTWVTWVLAGVLGVMIVVALGAFLSRQIGPVLAPDDAARRFAENALGDGGTPDGVEPGPEPLSRLADRLGDGSSGPEMIVIPSGRFMMGSPQSDPNRNWDEREHPVEIAAAFAIGRTEVTYAQYDKFAELTGRMLPESKDRVRGERPVVQVSWYDAIAYAEWLSEQTGVAYRLPTEAEWEYAARAGGSVPARLQTCEPESETGPEPAADQKAGAAPAVESKQDCAESADAPNASSENPWGLKYMAGNVWEWTCSRYARSYDGSEKTCASKQRVRRGDKDDASADAQEVRAIRGGSRVSRPKWLRATSRDSSRPSGRSTLLGFRLVRELERLPIASSGQGPAAEQ